MLFLQLIDVTTQQQQKLEELRETVERLLVRKYVDHLMFPGVWEMTWIIKNCYKGKAMQ